MRMNRKVIRRRDRKGQSLVEYALVIAGVALIAVAAVTVFGHKVSDMIGAVAAVLPGAHGDDNAPIVSGKLVETAQNADGNIAVDIDGIVAATGEPRLADNVLGAAEGEDGFNGLVVEAN